MNRLPSGDSTHLPDPQPAQNKPPPLPVRSSSIGRLRTTPVTKEADEISPIFEKVKTAIKNRQQNSEVSDAIAGRVAHFLGSKQSEGNTARVTALRDQINGFNVSDPQLLGVINQVLQLDDQVTRLAEIHQAIQKNDEEKLKTLLEEISPETFKKMAYLPNEKGLTIWRLISHSRKDNTMKIVAEKFPNEFKEFLLSRDADGNTPFHHAVKNFKPNHLLLFADLFPEVFKEGMSFKNNEGQTPAHLVGDMLGIAKIMLEKAPDEFKAALLTKDKKGNTPIYYAVFSPAQIKWLTENAKDQLSAGMTLQNGEGKTPVHSAIVSNFFHLLVSSVPESVNKALIVQDHQGQTPLHWGADKGSLISAFEILKPMSNFSKAMGILNNEGNSPFAEIKKHRERGFKAVTQQVKGDNVLVQETKEIFQRKAVAHALDLKGNSPLVRRADKTNIQSASLEGHFSEQWFNMMGKDFVDFEKRYDVLDDSQKILFQKAFEMGANSKSISLEEKHEKILAGEPVVLNTGFAGHAVTVVFWGKPDDDMCQVMICNRGAESRKPIEVYHFDRNKLELEDLAIENLTRTGTPEDYKNQLFKQWHEKLGLVETSLDTELMKDNPLPDQTVGNCSFVSPVTAMYALLMLDGVRKGNINSHAPDKVALEQIKAKSILTYQTWLGFQQIKTLERLISPITNKDAAAFEPDHPLILEALRKAYLLPLPPQSMAVLEKLAETYMNTLSFPDRLMIKADLGFRSFQRNLEVVVS